LGLIGVRYVFLELSKARPSLVAVTNIVNDQIKESQEQVASNSVSRLQNLIKTMGETLYYQEQKDKRPYENWEEEGFNFLKNQSGNNQGCFIQAEAIFLPLMETAYII